MPRAYSTDTESIAFANLQKQINQLSDRLEVWNELPPNPVMGGQMEQNTQTYQWRNFRNQPTIEWFQQVLEEFSDEKGRALPLERTSILIAIQIVIASNYIVTWHNLYWESKTRF